MTIRSHVLLVLSLILSMALPAVAAEQRLPGSVIIDAASFIDQFPKGDTISDAALPNGPWLFNNMAINLKTTAELTTSVQIPTGGNYHLFVRSQGSQGGSFRVAILGQVTEGKYGTGPLSWKDAGEFYLPKSTVDVRIVAITPGASFDVLVLTPDATLTDDALWTAQFPSEIVMFKDYKIPRADGVKFGDLNGDGKMDFVVLTPNYSVFAYDNSGTELWHWDAPQNGADARSQNEAPGVVWDFDHDGRAEIIHWRMMEGKEWLCMSDGVTGQIKSRVEWPTAPMPHPYFNFRTAIARLKPPEGEKGTPAYPDSLIVYSDTGELQTINAYGPKLELLWSHKEARQKDYFGHNIYAVDINGDSVSEIFLSHICLDAAGKVIWSDAGKYIDATDHVNSARFADLNGDGGLEMIAAEGELGTIAYRAENGEQLWKSASNYSEKLEVGNFLANAPAPQIVADSRILGATEKDEPSVMVRWLSPNGYALESWPPNPINGNPNFVKGDWRGDGKIELFWHRFRLDNAGKGTLYFPEEVFHMFDFAGNGAEQVIALNKKAGILRIYGFKDVRTHPAKRDTEYLRSVVANHSHN